LSKRYDFVYLFDCQDGNPNGDPDFDNAPRFDPKTFHGLVSDVCLKRKIRDYVAAAKSNEPGYRAHGFINAALAKQTEFTEGDLNLLWKALENMFDLDRSAARGLMSARGLYVFEHASSLGEAPAQRLFERVQVKLKDGIESPRTFDDYEVTVTEAGLPAGVKLIAPLATHAGV
jgi:CRISPR/Cas system type I-B associated protein Csh2 (Cas7 group RAMP superfamily)